MADERVMFCQRVADWDPNLQSVVDKCSTCGAAIWVALSSPRRVDRLICMQCGVAEFKGDPDVKVEPITKRQLADIRRSRK
jgi:ribosomal protein S27AE